MKKVTRILDILFHVALCQHPSDTCLFHCNGFTVNAYEVESSGLLEELQLGSGG